MFAGLVRLGTDMKLREYRKEDAAMISITQMKEPPHVSATAPVISIWFILRKSKSNCGTENGSVL